MWCIAAYVESWAHGLFGVSEGKVHELHMQSPSPQKHSVSTTSSRWLSQVFLFNANLNHPLLCRRCQTTYLSA